MKNVFYMHKISKIGGCESFLYYLSKIYKDFVVYYKVGDPRQIERLSKNVEVHKYTKPIKCERFFCSYGYDIEVEAKEYYHIVHYDAMGVGFTPMTNDGFKYIGVSKLACKSFEQKTGNKCELIYNPLPLKKINAKKHNDGKVHILCATRLTSEKGGKRIQKLASLSDDFIIDVYSNKTLFPIRKNIIQHDSKLDLTKEMAEADFVAQLSDTESFGLTPAESLCIGTPVIVTDIPAFKEIGCKHGENAVICNLDMSNVDVEMIKKGLPKFTYKPPKSTWDKYLSKESDYNPNDLIKVRTKRRIYDIEQNKHYKFNQVAEMTKTRASYMESLNYVEVL